MAGVEPDAGGGVVAAGIFLVEVKPTARLPPPRVVEQGRHRVGDVGAQRQRSEVVHGHHHAVVFAAVVEVGDNRRDDARIEVRDGGEFVGQRALVAGLVRGLEVHEDEVALAQGLAGGLRLALVVGVDIAGGAGDVDHLQAADHPQAFEQVDGADHRPADGEAVDQGRHRGHLALAPQPDLGRRVLAGGPPLLVDRVVGEKLSGLVEQLAPRAMLPVGLPVGGDVPADMVMGRHRGETGMLSFEDHQMAVADPGFEVKGRRRAVALEIGDELVGLLVGDVARAEIAHHHLAVALLVEGHQVAAEGGLIGSEVDVHRRRLEGGAAGVVARRVVAEQRHVGDVAARGKAIGHGLGEKELACGAEPVHGRGGGGDRKSVV